MPAGNLYCTFARLSIAVASTVVNCKGKQHGIGMMHLIFKALSAQYKYHTIGSLNCDVC